MKTVTKCGFPLALLLRALLIRCDREIKSGVLSLHQTVVDSKTPTEHIWHFSSFMCLTQKRRLDGEMCECAAAVSLRFFLERICWLHARAFSAV